LANWVSVVTVLRRKLLHSAIAVGIGAAIGIYFSDDLLAILKVPFLTVMGPHSRLYFTAPSESFIVYMTIGIIAGVIMAAPYLFLQLWWVLAPVLYRTRRRSFLFLAMLTAVTFVGGALFGYFGILPVAVEVLIKGFESKAAFEAYMKVSDFTSFALKLLLAFGLAFEMPVVMMILGRFGLIGAKTLWRGFRYAVVLVFLVAAVLTPPDLLTQVLLGVPLCLLYLFGVLLVAIFGKRRPNETAYPEQPPPP
jgi:sec-independent protein translocase protein TatC